MALVGLEVWSDSDKCPVTQDPFTTLHEFLDWRKVKLLPQRPHDNAQLIRCTPDVMSWSFFFFFFLDDTIDECHCRNVRL